MIICYQAVVLTQYTGFSHTYADHYHTGFTQENTTASVSQITQGDGDEYSTDYSTLNSGFTVDTQIYSSSGGSTYSTTYTANASHYYTSSGYRDHRVTGSTEYTSQSMIDAGFNQDTSSTTYYGSSGFTETYNGTTVIWATNSTGFTVSTSYMYSSSVWNTGSTGTATQTYQNIYSSTGTASVSGFIDSNSPHQNPPWVFSDTTVLINSTFNPSVGTTTSTSTTYQITTGAYTSTTSTDLAHTVPTTVTTSDSATTYSVNYSTVTYTAAAISRSMWTDPNNFYTYKTVYIPQYDLFHDDWFWILYPGNTLSQLFGVTWDYTHIYSSTHGNVSVLPYDSIVPSVYSVYESSAIQTLMISVLSGSSYTTLVKTISFSTYGSQTYNSSLSSYDNLDGSTSTMYYGGSFPMATTSIWFSYQRSYSTNVATTWTSYTLSAHSITDYDTVATNPLLSMIDPAAVVGTILYQFTYWDGSTGAESLLWTQASTTCTKTIRQTVGIAQNVGPWTTSHATEGETINAGATTFYTSANLFQLSSPDLSFFAFKAFYRSYGYQLPNYMKADSNVFLALDAATPMPYPTPYDFDYFNSAWIDTDNVFNPFTTEYEDNEGNTTGWSSFIDDSGTSYSFQWSSDGQPIMSVTSAYGYSDISGNITSVNSSSFKNTIVSAIGVANTALREMNRYLGSVQIIGGNPNISTAPETVLAAGAYFTTDDLNSTGRITLYSTSTFIISTDVVNAFDTIRQVIISSYIAGNEMVVDTYWAHDNLLTP